MSFAFPLENISSTFNTVSGGNIVLLHNIIIMIMLKLILMMLLLLMIMMMMNYHHLFNYTRMKMVQRTYPKLLYQ